jgi:RNA recognition motif-containing protein
MEKSMQHKIFVGNLAFSTEEDALRREFEDCGEITDLKLITDRETGRSKGFAFITFDTAEALEAALEKNNKELDGRNLRVNKAEEKAPSANRGGFGGGNSYGNGARPERSNFGGRSTGSRRY